LLGVYVAIFALISILFGRFVFKENIPNITWVGLMIIILGALIIQFGPAKINVQKHTAVKYINSSKSDPS
jgi:drug/metabolite transporter (DMT)-like permease